MSLQCWRLAFGSSPSPIFKVHHPKSSHLVTTLLCVLFISIICSASSHKIVPINPHVEHHPEHPPQHIVPLMSHTLVDPYVFLQRVKSQTEQNVRLVLHRDGHHTDPSFLQEPQQQASLFLLSNHSEAYRAIIPMSEFRHSHFVGPVEIGTPPQILRLIFDTGSTNIQVVCSWCKDETCTKVSRFDPSRSTTFQLTSPTIKLDITFGTGKIHSQLGTDRVAIGPFSVDSQAIGVIDHEGATAGKSNIFDHIDFEGIVGFGFPSLASASRVPLFDNIMNQGGRGASEFAIYMGHSDKIGGSASRVSSAFFIGGVDPRFYEGPIKMVPVVREHYWEIGLDALWVGDRKFCCDEGTSNFVIIDSGTSFNTLPYKEISRFREMVPKLPCDENMEEALKRFPTLTYKLTGGVDVVLTPDMYVIPTTDGDCEPAYMQIDVLPEFGHAYILGSIPYMRHYFTLFHRGKNGERSMIGIAKAKHTDEGISFLQSLEKNI